MSWNRYTSTPAGWSEWSTATPNTDHITFGEYNNNGYVPNYIIRTSLLKLIRAGDWNSDRASFATLLSSPISITTVLGSGYASWVDTSYLSATVASSSTSSTKASSTSTKASSSSTKASSTSTKASSTSSSKVTSSSSTSGGAALYGQVCISFQHIQYNLTLLHSAEALTGTILGTLWISWLIWTQDWTHDMRSGNLYLFERYVWYLMDNDRY